MQYFDVFNGDADGLCSLVQLRNAYPIGSRLITGIKRDIDLVKRANAAHGDVVTVLDVSFDKNAQAVLGLLKDGIGVNYFDHHQASQLIEHPLLQTHINTAPDVCTALIVDQHLQGKYRDWAITAAFGDNLTQVAFTLGQESGFSSEQLSVMQQLGICLNYNGYGASISDLFFDPADLFEKIRPFDSALAFVHDDGETFSKLNDGYHEDMAKAQRSPFLYESGHAAVIGLPNMKWARRVSGVFGNAMANQYADRAHAVITEKDNGAFLVSIRAPLANPHGADTLASQFATGGGRKAAAGINNLPVDDLPLFIDRFASQYS